MGKNLSKIPLPHIRGFFGDLKPLGVCLAVCNNNANEIEIWVMKEYKVESTWTRHVIVLPSVRLTSTPHSFTKGGKLIATNDSGHVKFNDKG